MVNAADLRGREVVDAGRGQATELGRRQRGGQRGGEALDLGGGQRAELARGEGRDLRRGQRRRPGWSVRLPIDVVLRPAICWVENSFASSALRLAVDSALSWVVVRPRVRGRGERPIWRGREVADRRGGQTAELGRRHGAGLRGGEGLHLSRGQRADLGGGEHRRSGCAASAATCDVVNGFDRGRAQDPRSAWW